MTKIPAKIITDMGETVVKKVESKYATKIHKCPICKDQTDFYEEHYLLFPVAVTGNRRYVHSNCLVLAIENDWVIELNSQGNFKLETCV